MVSHSIQDVVDMKIALERYEEIDPRFAPSREGKLLRVSESNRCNSSCFQVAAFLRRA